MHELRRTSSGRGNFDLVPMFIYFSLFLLSFAWSFVYYCIITSYLGCTDVVIEQVTCSCNRGVGPQEVSLCHIVSRIGPSVD